MSTLRELRRAMKERELQSKKSNPRPSPPTSEIGSVLFGSAKSEHFGSAASEPGNEQEETHMHSLKFSEILKILGVEVFSTFSRMFGEIPRKNNQNRFQIR